RAARVPVGGVGGGGGRGDREWCEGENRAGERCRETLGLGGCRGVHDGAPVGSVGRSPSICGEHGRRDWTELDSGSEWTPVVGSGDPVGDWDATHGEVGWVLCHGQTSRRAPTGTSSTPCIACITGPAGRACGCWAVRSSAARRRCPLSSPRPG